MMKPMSDSSRGRPAPSVSSSLGCAGCGDCCERVVMTRNRADFTGALSGAMRGAQIAGRWARDAAFVLKWMEPTGEVERNGATVRQVWRCNAFDAKTRQCTQHETRPLMCSGFPWYGRSPGSGSGLQPEYTSCSYWLDVEPADRPEGARPLIPIMVLS